MLHIKSIADKLGPVLIEKIGTFMNPLILNIKNEKKQLLVFYFHGLFESDTQKEFNHIDPQHNMTVTQFTDFIDYFLEHNFRFIVPEDLNTQEDNKSPFIMITFDDGYFNNMLAIKILERYHIPGLFFISTKNIIENKSYWWDIIYKYRIKQGKKIEEIRKEQELLKNFKNDFIDRYIIKNFGKKAFTPWSDIDRPFNINEIETIAQSSLVSIGNHTHNHAILTNYNKEEMIVELKMSNKIIYDTTGKSPISIAMPNGNYNELALEVAEKEGFKYAFTTRPAMNILQKKNKGMVCLDRYMSTTINIKKYGSFYRLGYKPDALYKNIKKRIKSTIVNTEEYD
jgi:peptidoglycan/xylan/chitin deacetylase (PgdA/CDA1 family)